MARFVPSARSVLDRSKGVIRLAELFEETPPRGDELDPAVEADVRRELDQLELAGEIERYTVGDHIMIKTTDAFDAPE
jgi:hypothetical protein